MDFSFSFFSRPLPRTYGRAYRPPYVVGGYVSGCVGHVSDSLILLMKKPPTHISKYVSEEYVSGVSDSLESLTNQVRHIFAVKRGGMCRKMCRTHWTALGNPV